MDDILNMNLFYEIVPIIKVPKLNTFMQLFRSLIKSSDGSSSSLRITSGAGVSLDSIGWWFVPIDIGRFRAFASR
jgi:hypothetical protein